MIARANYTGEVSFNPTNQEVLLNQLRNLFPNEQTHINARKKSNIKYPSGTYLELDIWIPAHQLAFEFQDAYHYVTTWYSQRSVDEVYQVDSAKKLLIQQQGISIVVIPCWWNGEADSLAATIKFERPEINPACDNLHLIPPISLAPPFGFFPNKEIPDVGELMLASFPSDPYYFASSVDSNIWWMGEKYDGIRCCWNPKKSKFYTRGAQTLPITTCVSAMPSFFVDSECWFGRGNYSASFSLLFSDNLALWSSLRLITFDAIPMRENKPFEERYSLLLISFAHNHSPSIIVAPRMLCKSSHHLTEALQSVIDDGGEGTILRRVGSLFEHGRSTSVLKLKSAVGDKEAIVVSITSGSVLLKLPSGVTFNVASENVLISTPKIGEVVTFTFDNYSRRDVPSNPKITRVRSDLRWDDVLLRSSTQEKPNAPTYVAQSQGHWTRANMRLLFEKFARKRGLDPLRAETWYNIPEKEVRQYKGGRTILRKFKGYYTTLVKLFPDIKFDGSAFPKFPRSTWHSVRNRRAFFEKYAKDNSFDPLKSENWNNQPQERIMAQKGAITIMKYHNQSVKKALRDLFPNIGIDMRRAAPSAWKDIDFRKKFFEDYAKSNGFDPQIPSNWYEQPTEKILACKGASEVLFYHNNSVSKALRDLFPNIGLEKHKFLSASSKLCPSGDQGAAISEEKPTVEQKRRKFFDNYATEKRFDSLVPENWYSQSKYKILAAGGFKVLLYYNDSVKKALLHLYPDIGLDPSKFVEPGQLNNANNRKRFFTLYAKENGFDPLIPDNWYFQPKQKIMASKGAHSVIYQHNDSISQALLDLFPDIGLDKMKFWAKSTNNRRSFLEKFAQANGFSPLNSEGWYKAPISKLVSSKEAESVLYYHKNSVAQALRDLFPSVGLTKAQLVDIDIVNNGKYQEILERYATTNGFDTLHLKSWLSLSKEKLMASKEMAQILVPYNFDISKALADIFPNMKIPKSKSQRIEV